MSRIAFLASFASVMLACGAHSNSAVAEPKKGAATVSSASSDQPLVPYALDQDADVVRALREHYTKYEFKIRMRDGVRLYTHAYVPKDASRTWPIMLMRTPYSVGPYGIDNMLDGKNPRALRRFAPSFTMIKEGYVFVHQDVRGRWASEGTFVDVRPAGPSGGVDESTDAFDTVDFLVKNVPNNNGRVGVWGISYPGFYAAQAAVNAHPAVKAVSPQAPVTEWFVGDDFHHNGALMLADSFDFYGNFGRPRPQPTKKNQPWSSEHETGDAYDFFLALGPIANANTKYFEGKIAFWNDLMTHGTRDDFWKSRDPRPRYRDSRPAIMTVGGWFDAEDLYGALETYRAFERGGPKNENVVVMGPWKHGGWARYDGDKLGDISFGAKTSTFYRDKIERPFFARHLKGEKGAAAAEAWMFETGTNEWHRYDAWPPPGSKNATLFFQPKGRLASAPAAESGAYEYISDPQKPVPYRAKPGPSIDNDYMTDDQRFAARRPDVVALSTSELDADVTLAGPIEASLWVTTTGTDADFVVKLVDVFPNDAEELGGYQMLVRAEIMRGKFRASFEKPEAFEPGKPTLVRFTIPDANHTFRTGHRIMVQVQSSWFPLADRNPQTFVDIAKATEADFKAATHRVLYGGAQASSLKVNVARGSLP
jgi:uncharacterized protein